MKSIEDDVAGISSISSDLEDRVSSLEDIISKLSNGIDEKMEDLSSSIQEKVSKDFKGKLDPLKEEIDAL